MTPRRAVSALLAVLAATMLVTGSFGFTSVSAERGVAVNVVESENAYVGVSACEKSNGNDNGTEPARVMVTNQFSEEFTVDDISWGEVTKQLSLDPGDSTTFNNVKLSDDTVTIGVTGGLDATVTTQVKEKGDCPKKLKKDGGAHGEQEDDGTDEGG